MQRFAKRRRQRLSGGRGGVRCQFDSHTPPSIVAHVVQREVSGNPEQPCPAAAVVGLRHLASSDAEKHLLRQLARILLPDDATEISEYAVAVRGEEDVSVSHPVTLLNKNTSPGRSSHAL